VDHALYDHTSIIATLREWFHLAEPLTRRDAAATPFSHLIDLPAPRSDTPATLPRPPRSRARSRALAPVGGAPLSDLQRHLLELADTVASVHQRAGIAAVRVRARAAAGEESARDYVQRVFSGQTAVSAALDAEAPSRGGPRSAPRPKARPTRGRKAKRAKKPKSGKKPRRPKKR
jgi:hypothetical protein